MATEEKIVYSVEVKSDKAGKSLSDLKKEFKDGQKELANLTQGTKEYVKQLEKLGGIKDDIGDLNQTIKAFNPEGKIQAIGKVAGGLASGFAAAQGAAALFGTENKDLEKTLVKVQAAMAFSQGIQGLASLGDGFKVLGAIIKSNPLFMIVAAVAAIGTALFALKDKIGFVGDAFDAIGKVIGYVVDKVKAFTDAIGLSSFALDEATEKQEAAYKKQGDAVQDRYDKEIKLLKAAGKDTLEVEKQKQKAIIETAQLQGKLLIEAALARGEWAEGEEARITAYIKTVQDAYTEIQVIEATQSKQREETSKKVAENLQKENNAFVEAFDKKEELRRKEAEENVKRSQEYLALKKKEADDEFQLKLAASDREIETENNRQLARAELNVLQNEGDIANQVALLQLKRDIELQNTELTESEKLLIKEKYAQQEKELTEVSTADTFAIAQASNDGMQALSDLYFMVKTRNLQKGSAAELKAAKDQFKINKALAITSATIQGVQAVLAAYSSGSAIPVVGAVTGPLFAALAAVTVGANIAKIASAKFDAGGAGGGGASVTAPSAPNIAPPTQGSTQLNTDGTIKQQPSKSDNVIKAVVVETDVTKTQKRVGSIETNAKL
jgi:hypothetical protein